MSGHSYYSSCRLQATTPPQSRGWWRWYKMGFIRESSFGDRRCMNVNQFPLLPLHRSAATHQPSDMEGVAVFTNRVRRRIDHFTKTIKLQWLRDHRCFFAPKAKSVVGSSGRSGKRRHGWFYCHHPVSYGRIRVVDIDKYTHMRYA